MRDGRAIDVLAERACAYDSSIHPCATTVTASPTAVPCFRVRGGSGRPQIPPATLRLERMNVLVGGGGYFRLLPLSYGRALAGAAALRPAGDGCPTSPVGMLTPASPCLPWAV